MTNDDIFVCTPALTGFIRSQLVRGERDENGFIRGIEGMSFFGDKECDTMADTLVSELVALPERDEEAETLGLGDFVDECDQCDADDDCGNDHVVVGLDDRQFCSKLGGPFQEAGARTVFGALGPFAAAGVIDLSSVNRVAQDPFVDGGCYLLFFEPDQWDLMQACGPLPRVLPLSVVAVLSFAFRLSDKTYVFEDHGEGRFHVRRPYSNVEKLTAASPKDWLTAYVMDVGYLESRNDVLFGACDGGPGCRCRGALVTYAPPDPCCNRIAGYYCDYSMSMVALESEDWVLLTDLTRLIRLLRTLPFHVQSSRTEALQQLASLKTDAPFGHCKRFPCDVVYVNWTCSVYRSKITQMVLALNTKNREQEKQSVANPGKTEPETTDRSQKWSLDDALVSFHQAVQAIDASMCKRDAFFDRTYFEKRYEMRWCPGECKQCIDPPPTGEIPPRPPGGDKPGNPPPGNPSPPPGPPNQPPSPNPPPKDTFGDVKRALTNIQKNPADYYFFEGLPTTFRCGDQTRALTQADDGKQMKPGGDYFFFTKEALTQCPTKSSINGYTYDVATASLTEKEHTVLGFRKWKNKHHSRSGSRTSRSRERQLDGGAVVSGSFAPSAIGGGFHAV